MIDEDDELRTRRGGVRLGWVLTAVMAAVAVVAVVVLTVQREDKDPGDFAEDVAAALTQGGDERIRSVFCESTPERSRAVDVFALVRPIKVTVDTVVEKDDTNATALLVVDKANDRMVIAAEKQADWCVSELILCTPTAKPTTDPPRLPCYVLIGRD